MPPGLWTGTVSSASGASWFPRTPAAAPVRIVALAGAGVEKSGATEDLVAFAERFEIPVATTLRAKGVFPEDHRLSLGVFGYAGHRHAIDTILSDEVEVLLVLGSGLSQRDTLFWDRQDAAQPGPGPGGYRSPGHRAHLAGPGAHGGRLRPGAASPDVL